MAVDRAPGHVARRLSGLRQFVCVHGTQPGQIAGAELRGQPDTRLFGRRGAELALAQLRGRDHVGALGDRFRKQPARRRGRHQVHDAQRAGGFADDGHVVRVAAEGCDVPLHPFQRRDLVEKPVIPRHAVRRFGAQFGMRQIAQNAKPVVDRDDHRAARGKSGAVVELAAGRAPDQRSAVDPHDDRRTARVLRCPHVQRQAILAGLPDLVGIDAFGAAGRLDRSQAEARRVARLAPRRHGHGRLPAAVAHRRQRVWNALEELHAVMGHAPKWTAGSVHHRAAVAGGRVYCLLRRHSRRARALGWHLSFLPGAGLRCRHLPIIAAAESPSQRSLTRA